MCYYITNTPCLARHEEEKTEKENPQYETDSELGGCGVDAAVCDSRDGGNGE